MSLVGTSFNQLKDSVTSLVGHKDDLIAVKDALSSISKVNNVKGGIFGEIKELFSKPLKVEFADKNITLNNDVTLNIDKEQFMRKIYSVPIALDMQQGYRLGIPSS